MNSYKFPNIVSPDITKDSSKSLNLFQVYTHVPIYMFDAGLKLSKLMLLKLPSGLGEERSCSPR